VSGYYTETTAHTSTTGSHGFFANAVRSEWAIETGYHGKREFACDKDVSTRRCNVNVVGAMLLANYHGVRVHGQVQSLELPAVQERTTAKSSSHAAGSGECASKLNHHAEN